MSEANKAVVRKLWATLYTKNWDALEQLFHADAFYEDVPTPDPGARGPKHILTRLRIGLVMLPESSVMRRNVPLPVASIHRWPAVPPR